MSDAFELHANVANFVYYGKTRIRESVCQSWQAPPLYASLII